MSPASKQPKEKNKHKHSFKNDFLHFTCSCAVAIALLLVTFNLNMYLNRDKVLGAQIEERQQNELLAERNFWQNLVSLNPTYRDGWVELARVEMKLGNSTSSYTALEKAAQIDPNSTKVAEARRELGF